MMQLDIARADGTSFTGHGGSALLLHPAVRYLLLWGKELLQIAIFPTRVGSLHRKKAAERPGAREGAMCITPSKRPVGAQLGDRATIKLRLEGATVASFLQLPTLSGKRTFAKGFQTL